MISSALVVTKDDVMMKKMSNKNTRSVIELMLNSALTLLLDRKFIVRVLGRFV